MDDIIVNVNRRRKITLALVALTLALVVVGLALKSPSQSRRKYPERISVRFWHMWTAEWKVVVDKIVDRYNESQTKYEVIALSVPSSGADTKFLLSSVGGDPPDVMAQWNPVIPTWADNSLLEPFDNLMSPEELRYFKSEAYPVVQKIGTYKGKIYGVPIGLNMQALYYHPDHLAEVGITPETFPKTLEELSKVSQKLHRFGDDKSLKRLGFLVTGWASLAPMFGGGFYDWKREQVTIDTPENLRTLEFIVAEYKRLGYFNVIRFNAGLDTASFSGGWPFVGQAYSITLDGQWRVEEIRKYASKLKYKTVPMPSPAGGPKLAGRSSGNFMIIPQSAKHKDGAYDFVKFWSGISNPDIAAEFYTWGAWLPLSPDVANAPIYKDYLKQNPEFKTFVDMMPSENIDVSPPVSFQVFLNDQIARAEDRAVRGTIAPKQAVAELKAAVDKELARRRKLGYDR